MELLPACKCYLCGDRLVERCYRKVLICMECDARARSLFVLPILRQRLRMEPTPEMVMTVARFAGPCLDMRRKFHYLRAVLLAYNSDFHYFCDHSGGPGLISCNEDIMDRILSFLGCIGDVSVVYRRSERHRLRTRSLYVVREDLYGQRRSNEIADLGASVTRRDHAVRWV